MIPAVRQEKILELLSSNDIVSTDSLMKVLDVSVSTLRRDLVKLEEEKKNHPSPRRWRPADAKIGGAEHLHQTGTE